MPGILSRAELWGRGSFIFCHFFPEILFIKHHPFYEIRQNGQFPLFMKSDKMANSPFLLSTPHFSILIFRITSDFSPIYSDLSQKNPLYFFPAVDLHQQQKQSHHLDAINSQVLLQNIIIKVTSPTHPQKLITLNYNNWPNISAVRGPLLQ